MASLVELSDWLSRLPDRLEPQQHELQSAAENQTGRIKERTAQGVSVDLQLFPLYSPSTKKPLPVNLRQTGAMLDSITVYADESFAQIFFGDPEQAKIAQFHNSGTKWLP